MSSRTVRSRSAASPALSAVAARPGSSMSPATNCAPASSSRNAMPCPIPDPAPDTTTRRPSNLRMPRIRTGSHSQSSLFSDFRGANRNRFHGSGRPCSPQPKPRKRSAMNRPRLCLVSHPDVQMRGIRAHHVSVGRSRRRCPASRSVGRGATSPEEAMTQTIHSDPGALRSTISGRVFGPGDAGYDTARNLWYGDIDKRPAVIACCRSAEDVSAALSFGREHGLEIAVRGGGHAFNGSSCVDDGLMINLSAMNQVTVDPQAELARVGGGATMADMDSATQAHGYAVPGGTIRHTGTGGLTLGGGRRWLYDALGLPRGNLVAGQVVLAVGSIVRASDDENADLFWAVRGGGGNFGVVTEVEFRLHRLGLEAHFGHFFGDRDAGAD